jgi:hypothetical protein
MVGVDFLVCGSVALGNATVAKDVTLGQIQIAVQPPANVTAPGSNLYVPEIVTSNASVLSRFQALGYAARLGTMAFSNTGAAFMATVKGDGFQYVFSEAGSTDPNGVPVKSSFRIHHAEGGRLSWLNVTRSGPESQLTTTGTAQAQGGILGRLVDATGTLPLAGQPATGLTVTFDRPDVTP